MAALVWPCASTSASLLLRGFGLDDSDAEELARRLTESSVTAIDLSLNRVSDKGLQTITAALDSGRSLISLSLSGNAITSQGAKALLRTKRISELDLSRNALGTDTSFLDGGLEGIIKLDLSHCALQGPQQGKTILSQNSTLKELVLASNEIRSTEWLGSTFALHSLTSLDLANNPLADASILIDAFATNMSLRKLVLANCRMGAAFPGGGSAFVETFASSLAINTSLVYLDLKNNGIGPNGMNILSKTLKLNSTLQTLNLCGNQLGNLGALFAAQALMSNSCLSSLDLSQNSMGNHGATHIASALATTTAVLAELSLSWNEIGPAGGESLAEMLAHNSSLCVLLLGHNPLGNGANWIISSLMSNSKLCNLSLEDNQISADLNWMAQMLVSNSSLTSLNVDGNFIGDLGACSVADALAVSNCTLTTIGLGENGIGDCGAERLASALLSNGTLTQLQLAGNQIGNHGAASIAEALGCSTSLRSLNLLTNKIGNQGAHCLANVLLSSDCGLHDFSLSIEDDICGRVANMFAQSMEKKSSLTSLDIRVHEASENALAMALKAHPPANGGYAQLLAVKLNKFAASLGLPSAASMWCNRRILASLWLIHVFA